jgi:hypothetical protein
MGWRAPLWHRIAAGRIVFDSHVFRRVAGAGGQAGPGQTLVARISPLTGESLRMDMGDTRIQLRIDGQGRSPRRQDSVQNVVVERQ